MNANKNNDSFKTEIGADEVHGDVIRKDEIGGGEAGDSALIHEEIRTDPVEVPPGSEQARTPAATDEEIFEEANKEEGRDSNPDPITGEPGSHPVGTGVEATAGGAAGAVIGSVGGPVGTLVGAAVGAFAGGLTGKGVAESVHPSEEDAFWREHHAKQPYAREGTTYDEYAPAYRAGYTGYRKDQPFDATEEDVRRHYESRAPLTNEEKAMAMPGELSASPGATLSPGSSGGIPWDQGGREAARAVYERAGQRHSPSKPTNQ